MRAAQRVQGVACITPAAAWCRAADAADRQVESSPWRRGCSVLVLACAAAVSACGSGSGDTAADNASATAASVALQVMGADLLPPDADIAGTATASSELPDEDLSPANASSTATTDLLPPA